LLAAVAASMSLQASKLLIQADFLSAAAPLWDSSWLVEEDSLFGQLLYALMGYEATPSLVEVIAYAGSLLVVITVAWLGYAVFAQKTGKMS
jgi:high-affinity iron transporter